MSTTICPSCRGKGAFTNMECDLCGGFGNKHTPPCEPCGNTGTLPDWPCTDCGGRGVVSVKPDLGATVQLERVKRENEARKVKP